jgi:hypothetical protein
VAETTDHVVARAEPQPPSKSTGVRLDELVANIRATRREIARASRDLGDAERHEFTYTAELVDLVGRPAAAKLLDMTPRELAGLLRGAK